MKETPEQIRTRMKAFDERQDKERAEQLARAVRKAEESGKEPYDVDRLLELWTPSSRNPPTREQLETSFRFSYYVHHPRYRTLAEFAESLKLADKWAD